MTTPHLNGVMRQNPMSPRKFVERAVRLQRCSNLKPYVTVATAMPTALFITTVNIYRINSY